MHTDTLTRRHIRETVDALADAIPNGESDPERSARIDREIAPYVAAAMAERKETIHIYTIVSAEPHWHDSAAVLLLSAARHTRAPIEFCALVAGDSRADRDTLAARLQYVCDLVDRERRAATPNVLPYPVHASVADIGRWVAPFRALPRALSRAPTAVWGKLLVPHIHADLRPDADPDATVVCLDDDMLVFGDLATIVPVFSLVTSIPHLAAVPNLWAHVPRAIARILNPAHIPNTGALLFSPAYVRDFSAARLFAAAVEASEYGLHSEELTLARLAEAGDVHVARLPLAWNCFLPLMTSYGDTLAACAGVSAAEYASALRAPSIVHFIGAAKPWFDERTLPVQFRRHRAMWRRLARQTTPPTL